MLPPGVEDYLESSNDGLGRAAGKRNLVFIFSRDGSGQSLQETRGGPLPKASAWGEEESSQTKVAGGLLPIAVQLVYRLPFRWPPLVADLEGKGGAKKTAHFRFPGR